MDDQTNNFKKKRQDFAYNIRKVQREQKMRRRRNIDGLQQTSTKRKICIIDQSIRTQLEEFMNQSYQIQNIGELAQLVMGQNILLKHKGAIGIRMLLCNNSEQAIQYFIKLGLAPHFIMFMQQQQYLQLKLQAAWSLANILNGNSQQCTIIVSQNVIPILIEIVKHQQLAITEQGIWALGNLAAQNFEYRNQILQLGGLRTIIGKVQEFKSKAQIKNAAWAISNLCRGTPPPSYQPIKIATPIIASIIKTGILDQQPQILSDCLWSLSYLVEGPKLRLQRILQTNILPKICEYCKSKYPIVYVPAMRILGSCSTGNQYQTNRLIQIGFLDLAIILLDHDRKVVRRQICWALSNIAAGSQEQALNLLTKAPLLQKLYNKLKQEIQPEVKIQVCWLFANLGRTCEPGPLVNLYLQVDLVNHICSFLTTDMSYLIYNGLDLLYKILITGDKVKQEQKNKQIQADNQILKQVLAFGYGPVLQKLQEHQQKGIYNSVNKILERFFRTQ